MGRSVSRSMSVLAVLAALWSGVVPAAAAWTKLYRCYNDTGTQQSGMKAILDASEGIPSQYSDPSKSCWAPPNTGAKVGTETVSGVTCTTLTYPGGSCTALPNRNYISIGWTTADNVCRLSSLRWGKTGGGAVVTATLLEGVSGGGVAVYNYPTDGDLTLAITNDNVDTRLPANRLCLRFDRVAYAVSPHRLSLPLLYRLLADGFSWESPVGGPLVPTISPAVTAGVTGSPYSGLGGVSATDAASLLSALRAEVVSANSGGILNALVTELDNAVSAITKGRRAYYNGNRVRGSASLHDPQLQGQGSWQFADLDTDEFSGRDELLGPPSSLSWGVYSPDIADSGAVIPAFTMIEFPQTAQEWWKFAAQKLDTFVSRAGGMRGEQITQAQYTRWVTAGSRIRDILRGLSEVPLMLEWHLLLDLPSPEALGKLPPTVPGLNAGSYQRWGNLPDRGPTAPTGRLRPGEWTAVVVQGERRGGAGMDAPAAPGAPAAPAMPAGGALIIRGSLVSDDAQGHHEFTWLEQIVAEDAPPIGMVGWSLAEVSPDRWRVTLTPGYSCGTWSMTGVTPGVQGTDWEYADTAHRELLVKPGTVADPITYTVTLDGCGAAPVAINVSVPSPPVPYTP